MLALACAESLIVLSSPWQQKPCTLISCFERSQVFTPNSVGSQCALIRKQDQNVFGGKVCKDLPYEKLTWSRWLMLLYVLQEWVVCSNKRLHKSLSIVSMRPIELPPHIRRCLHSHVMQDKEVESGQSIVAAAAVAPGSTSSILYSSPLLQNTLVEYSCEQDRIARIFSLQSHPVTLTVSAKTHSVAFADAQGGLGLLDYKNGMQTKIKGKGFDNAALHAKRFACSLMVEKKFSLVSNQPENSIICCCRCTWKLPEYAV